MVKGLRIGDISLLSVRGLPPAPNGATPLKEAMSIS